MEAVIGLFLHPTQARQGFHICSTRTFPTMRPELSYAEKS